MDASGTVLLTVWYDLSDVKLAEALDDRVSFRRFLRFSAVPSPRTERSPSFASASEGDEETRWVKHKYNPAVHGFKTHVGADVFPSTSGLGDQQRSTSLPTARSRANSTRQIDVMSRSDTGLETRRRHRPPAFAPRRLPIGGGRANGFGPERERRRAELMGVGRTRGSRRRLPRWGCRRGRRPASFVTTLAGFRTYRAIRALKYARCMFFIPIMCSFGVFSSSTQRFL